MILAAQLSRIAVFVRQTLLARFAPKTVAFAVQVNSAINAILDYISPMREPASLAKRLVRTVFLSQSALSAKLETI